MARVYSKESEGRRTTLCGLTDLGFLMAVKHARVGRNFVLVVLILSSSIATTYAQINLFASEFVLYGVESLKERIILHPLQVV